MAYRFLREGLYTRRTKLGKNGYHPFIDNLMWDVTDWHYKYYMRKVAKNSIMKQQEDVEMIYKNLMECVNDKVDTNKIFLRNATPTIVPFKRQSNPFCCHSHNKSGWTFEHRKLEKTPRPLRTRKIAGTDISVPTMPRH